ncbi:calcineurin B homologous protein 1-like [Oscarella lobularis]|uniref:calcineurin B homologous protein 1-like n=1 Tax=Oscarella lobularis TaxID=121494 RepID=UPI0033131486
MGSNFSKTLREEEIEEIESETGFTAKQITRLYNRYSNLDKANKGYLGREDFQHIPEIAINPLGERIIDAFFDQDDGDGVDQQARVNFRQFIRVLAQFRPVSSTRAGDLQLNAKAKKLKFVFDVYDLDKDEKISREDLTKVLQMMVGSNVTSDQLNSIADCTMAEIDEDKDGFISYDKFCKAMDGIKIDEKMSIRFL